jgi:hypothetical protein
MLLNNNVAVLAIDHSINSSTVIESIQSFLERKRRHFKQRTCLDVPFLF